MSYWLEDGDLLEQKYRVFNRIGKGGMGVVYEAEHVHLKRRCAIKVLHPNEAEDPGMIARFRAEAQAVANVRHPNIVEVMDFGITPDNRPFFVMEFLEGEALGARLKKIRRFSSFMAVEIIDEILRALIHAHSYGVIHRDLKPDNIFLTKIAGTKETVKILDFGIAKMMAGTMRSQELEMDGRPHTTKGLVLGTPGYIAPESLFGMVEVDQRADIFSVGALLYAMLTGKRPFSGATPHDVLVSTITAPIIPPTKIRPELSMAMEQLVMIALAKDPEDRFASAEEFLDFLTSAAVGRVPEGARQCRYDVSIPSYVPDGVTAEKSELRTPPSSENNISDTSGDYATRAMRNEGSGLKGSGVPPSASPRRGPTPSSDLHESPDMVATRRAPTPISSNYDFPERADSQPPARGLMDRDYPGKPPHSAARGEAALPPVPLPSRSPTGPRSYPPAQPQDSSPAAPSQAPPQSTGNGNPVGLELDWERVYLPKKETFLHQYQSKPPQRPSQRLSRISDFFSREGRTTQMVTWAIRILIVGMVVALFYFGFVKRPGNSQHDEHPGEQETEPAHESLGAAGASADPTNDVDQAIPKTVQIWIDSKPRDVTIRWNGQKLTERPLLVAGDNKTAVVLINARGYFEEKRYVTPVKDQTIHVVLKKRQNTKTPPSPSAGGKSGKKRRKKK